jgi:hypothetical protein
MTTGSCMLLKAFRRGLRRGSSAASRPLTPHCHSLLCRVLVLTLPAVRKGGCDMKNSWPPESRSHARTPYLNRCPRLSQGRYIPLVRPCHADRHGETDSRRSAHPSHRRTNDLSSKRGSQIRFCIRRKPIAATGLQKSNGRLPFFTTVKSAVKRLTDRPDAASESPNQPLPLVQPLTIALHVHVRNHSSRQSRNRTLGVTIGGEDLGLEKLPHLPFLLLHSGWTNSAMWSGPSRIWRLTKRPSVSFTRTSITSTQGHYSYRLRAR